MVVSEAEVEGDREAGFGSWLEGGIVMERCAVRASAGRREEKRRWVNRIVSVERLTLVKSLVYFKVDEAARRRSNLARLEVPHELYMNPEIAETIDDH